MRAVIVIGAFLASTTVVVSSPEETTAVVDYFYESVELNEYYQGKLVKNGDVLKVEDVQEEPTFSLFHTSVDKNYTIVLLDNDDNAGAARAFMIIGNVPGDGSKGVYKLPYLAPSEQYMSYHDYPHNFTFILYEMANYIPRWSTKDNKDCEENKGQMLVTPFCADKDWPDCLPDTWVDDPQCIAWKELPMHHKRNMFLPKAFAKLNNLTAVDVKWFRLEYPEGHPAHPDYAKLQEPYNNKLSLNALQPEATP